MIQYYVKVFKQNKIYGPYSEDHIKTFISQNKISKEDSISTDKENWIRITEFTKKIQELSQTKEHINLIGNSDFQDSTIYKKKYKILGKLGQGGMGVVYKAIDLKLSRECAIKILLEDKNENLIKRFIEEAKAIAALNHPNIITVYEIETSPRFFFTMEYVDGPTLAELIKQEKLDTKTGLEIFYNICNGMEYAHRNNIIHRDLKPSNIILDQSNKPKIMDFGLAKHLDVETDLSRTGQILGTPKYISPEQAEGIKVDKRCDIYSLGAILYEIVTGRAPFEGETPLQILTQLAKDEPIPPSRLNPSISKDIEVISLKCLEKDRNNRFANIRILSKEIKRIIDNEPIKTKPPSLIIISKKWCIRQPLTAVLLFFFIFSFLGMLFSYVELSISKKRIEKQSTALKTAYQNLKKEMKKRIEAENKAKLEYKNSKILEYMNEAFRQAESGVNPENIIKTIKKAIDLDAENFKIYQQRTKIFYFLGIKEKDLKKQKYFFDIAIESQKKCEQLNPEDYIASFYIWQIAKFKKDTEKKNEYLNKLTDPKIKNEYGYFGKAAEIESKLRIAKTIAEKKRLEQEKLEYYTKAIEFNPKFADAYIDRGLLFCSKKEYEKAEEDIHKAISIDPENSQAFTALGAVKLHQQKTEEAGKILRRAFDLNSNSINLWLAKSNFCQQKGELEKALKCLEKALFINPKCIEAYLFRASIYIEEKLFNKAKKDIEMAISLAPEFARAYIIKGRYYIKKGLIRKAEENLEKSISISPVYFPEAYFYRANM